MRRIRKNSEIKVGDRVIVENELSTYFKTKKTTVTISRFDGSNWWCHAPKDRFLNKEWIGFQKFCIGTPELVPFKFYKK
jgi:hypothetical protein